MNKNNKSLVIIEPDNITGKIYEKFFKSNNINVHCVQDAQKAIEKINQNIPHILITELQLPSHSGIELLNEIRSYSDWQKILIIILTCVPYHDSGFNSNYMHTIGVSEYLYKPKTSLQTLLNIIKSYE
jgi:DNA-binding response OmpR family regulator